MFLIKFNSLQVFFGFVSSRTSAFSLPGHALTNTGVRCVAGRAGQAACRGFPAGVWTGRAKRETLPSMAGRKNTPTALKLIRGNPGRRPLPEHEPAPEARIPDPPEHLSAQAREHWNAVARMLHDARVMTVMDGHALELLCDSYVRYVEANEKVRRHGMVMKTPGGFFVQSPFLAIANKAFEQMKSILTEFGMTPASRTKIQTTDAKQKASNPWDAFGADE